MGRELSIAELRANPRMPKPGDFYADDETSELVWVVSVWDMTDHEPDYEFYPTRVEFKRGDEENRHESWYQRLSDFLSDYTPAPDGAQRIAAEVEAIAEEVGDEQRRVLALGESMRALGAGSEPGEGPAVALTGGEQGVQYAAELKKRVAEVRNDLAKAQKQLKVKTERTQLLIRKQQRAMEARVEAETAALQARMKDVTAELQKQMTAMTEMLKTAQETIWTINLYLGKDETVVPLMQGKPAPSETPIAMRQRRLFMDEESAINADEGGIDFRSIEQFDEWVKQPAHLQQVLPEKKGVVAIKVRRHKKEYGNPFMNDQAAKLNAHTYFLMRNGENLYRIDTELEVGDVLFPREDHFVDLFESERYNRTTGEREKVKLEPGSEEYMKMLKVVSAEERHFLRIFLFLQGLLDRTPIFHSRPEDANRRINVFDMMRQDDHIQFIRDAEEKRLLGTARPPFAEWLARINAMLAVGCRVVGLFPGYFDKYEVKRIYPTSASAPSDEEIHTIERTESGLRYRKKDEEAFVFLYQRDDRIYRRYERNGDARVRASYKLFQDDEFFINIDGAKVDDMEWYLQSRTERHAYAKMFPVLKRAIALKRAEEQEEAPFRDALAGMLMREYQLDDETARAAVEELVTWWKFKNHTHRALAADDAKASRMILREYGLRLKRAKERQTFDVETAVEKLRLLSDGIAPLESGPIIYIGHKAGKEFVVLRAMNDENIFVSEETYAVAWDAKTGLVTALPSTVGDVKDWVGIDNRRLRWHQVYATPRFEEFVKDERVDAYLTDPEERQVIERAWERIEPRFTDRKERSYDMFSRGGLKGRDTHYTFRRVAVFRSDKDRELQLWAQTTLPVVPDRLLTERIEEPAMRRFDISWERSKGEVTVSDDGGAQYLHGWQFGQKSAPEGKVLWSDNAARAAFSEDVEIAAKARLHRRRLEELRSALYKQAVTEATKRRHDALLANFLADHGDMELWEDYLAEKKLNDLSFESFKYAAYVVEEKARRVDGMTVDALLREGYQTYVRVWHEEHEAQKRGGTTFSGHFAPDGLSLEADLPLDLVLVVPEDWADDLKLDPPSIAEDEDIDDYLDRVTAETE